MEKKGNKDSKFWISRKHFNKIIAYAESAYHQLKCEIGGQMVVIEDSEGDFILKDPVILKQEVSGGNCTLEAEALAVHYSKMATKYGDDVRHCWWHSHHTMQAYWSPTDNATILENTSNDFTVSLVVNLKQEYKLRVQFFHPFEHEENVTLNFLSNENKRNNKVDKEVEELCEKETFVTNLNGKPINSYKSHNHQTTLGFAGMNDDYDDYNMLGVHYSHYTRNDKLDLHKIPKDKVKLIADRIDVIQNSLLDDDIDYHTFKASCDDLNKDLKQYNLRMKNLSKDEMDNAGYQFWPEDFLENIEGRDTVVH